MVHEFFEVHHLADVAKDNLYETLQGLRSTDIRNYRDFHFLASIGMAKNSSVD